MALTGLLARAISAAEPGQKALGGLPGFPNLVPKAKRIIYLFQSGAPSQMDLFDYKPLLNKLNGEQLPEEVRGGQRLTGMTAQQSSIPMAGSLFEFKQHGRSGAWFSELLPHTAAVADELCVIRSMYTEAINQDPAITFFQTGSQIAGRPSLGSWIHYGLGSINENLPAFVVLVTPGKADQPLYSRLWGSGFLDSRYQGVQFRSGKEPILYMANPDGPCGTGRRALLDKLKALNRRQFEKEPDPEIESRIAQYEMAYRMQTSVPEVTDLSKEPDTIFDLYGPDSRKPGTFAANCLLARRLAERGVRFIQLYHQGWDQHDNLPKAIRTQAKERRRSQTRHAHLAGSDGAHRREENRRDPPALGRRRPGQELRLHPPSARDRDPAGTLRPRPGRRQSLYERLPAAHPQPMPLAWNGCLNRSSRACNGPARCSSRSEPSPARST